MHNQIASFRAALDARPVSRYQWLDRKSVV